MGGKSPVLPSNTNSKSSKISRREPLEGTTSLQVIEDEYCWTIKKWKSLLNCSATRGIEEVTLYSEVFEIPIDRNKITRWQIKAYPGFPDPKNGKEVLVCQLISHNIEVPRGTFQFVTYTKGIIYGQKVHYRSPNYSQL